MLWDRPYDFGKRGFLCVLIKATVHWGLISDKPREWSNDRWENDYGHYIKWTKMWSNNDEIMSYLTWCLWVTMM
jgi:hypothetical protein